MTETAGPELATAAADYAKRGWPVFPCIAGRKEPYKEKGFFEHGVLDAKTSPYWVGQYWRKWPSANVGLAVGETGTSQPPDVSSHAARCSAQSRR